MRHLHLWAVLLVALGLWVHARSELPSVLLTADESEYADIARQLVRGEGFTTHVVFPALLSFGIFHWRPLVNGYHGYWPAAFPERMRLAAELPDPTALAALRSATGLELILVHVRDLPPGRARRLARARGGGRRERPPAGRVRPRRAAVRGRGGGPQLSGPNMCGLCRNQNTAVTAAARSARSAAATARSQRGAAATPSGRNAVQGSTAGRR
jgi:hypothetical protein